MKIEIQASGESPLEIVAAINELTRHIICSHPDNWHVLVGTAQASAVVVQEDEQ